MNETKSLAVTERYAKLLAELKEEQAPATSRSRALHRIISLNY